MSTTPTEPRPDVVTEEHLEYLDDLRESGVTNMYGAAPFLMTAFGLPAEESIAILSYWMHTFSIRHPKGATHQ